MKTSLTTITNAQNVSAINDNFSKIQDALNNSVLWRDNPVGEPNQMSNIQDMNGQKIINLGEPTDPNDAARLKDLQDVAAGMFRAENISFAPSANIWSTNVQDALEEVDRNRRTGDSDTLTAAKAYADAGDTATLANANSHADTGDASTLASAKAYTDAATANGTVTDAKVASNAAIASSKLAYLQAGTGAVSRTVQDKLRDIISVKDFGAKGDGSTDDSAAFQTALAYCASVGSEGIELVIPSGDYLLNSAISFNGSKQLSVVGCGTPKLIFKDTTMAVAFSITSTMPVKVSGIKLIVPPNASAVRTAVKITGGQNNSIYLRDVEVWRDASFGTKAIIGFDLVNPSLSRIEYCKVNGFPGTAYAALSSGGIGFKMSATNQISTDSVFDNCNVNGVETGFFTDAPLGGAGGAYLEGITWINCTIVGSQVGVLAKGDASTSYRSVLYRWIGGHINAQVYSLHFLGLNQIHVSDAVLYLDRNNSPQANILFENCYDANAHGNTLMSIDQLGAGGSTSGSGIVFDSTCTLGTARNNTIDGILGTGAAIWGQAGSNRIYVSMNTMRSTGTTGVLLQGDNSVDQGGNVLF